MNATSPSIFLAISLGIILLSRLFYPWPVIFGFVSSIIISQIIIMFCRVIFSAITNNDSGLMDDPMDIIQVMGIFIYVGLIVYFIFVIPFYMLLATEPYALPVKYTFVAFLSICTLGVFMFIVEKQVPWYAYVSVFCCGGLHAYLAMWFIEKYSI